MTAISFLRDHRQVAFLDLGLLASIYLLPSLSHLLALPLYLLEPMRLALIVALLFSHRWNALFVAFTLPMASAWITGHPEPLKALLMGVEYCVLVSAWSWLARPGRLSPMLALGAGIVLGKAVYYLLKAGALAAGWLSGGLVSTPWTLQLATAAGTAVLFGLIEKWRHN